MTHDPKEKKCPRNHAEGCPNRHKPGSVSCKCGGSVDKNIPCTCKPADTVESLRAELETVRADNKRLTDALQEISQTLGPYKIDAHEFAISVIQNMQDIALSALVDNWAELKEQKQW